MPDIEFSCPKCGKRYRTSSITPGSRVKCKKCSHIITYEPEEGMAASPAPFKSGDTLGSYRITRRIGSGGMGIVYQAKHTQNGRIVAIKSLTIKGSGTISSSHTRRFLREARLAAAISHPNVVQVIGFIQKNGFYHIVLEYVGGGSLKTLLLKEGTLQEKRALEITLGTAQALVEAAKVRIVHRDIKPDNIMLSEEGVPKLADLGLATQEHDDTLQSTAFNPANLSELYSSNNHDGSLTMCNIAMGTPAYMAPEQSRDSRSVDARADIYSLGATLYHMLAGDPPFIAKTMRELLSMHRHSDVPDINNTRTGLCPETVRIINRCLQKEPENRFASAVELVLELEAAIKILQNTGDSTLGVGKEVHFYEEPPLLHQNSSADEVSESMLYESTVSSHAGIFSRENLVFILALMLAVGVVYLAYSGVESWYEEKKNNQGTELEQSPDIDPNDLQPAEEY